MDGSTSLSRRAVLSSAASAVAVSSLGARGAAAATAPWSSVSARARALVAEKIVPGLSLAVMRGGKFIRTEAHGLANIETGTAVTPTSVFKVGSVTKQFTGAALILLDADGALALDDRFSNYFPDFPRAADFTLRQMAHHVAGLGNYTVQPSVEEFRALARVDRDPAALFAAMRANTSPLFIAEPGMSFMYSNTGYVLLGLVIEKVTGKPLEDFFRRRLFEPAGLRQTAVDDAAEVLAGRVSGYSGGPKAAAAGFENASFISMSFPGAAGSLRSTASDLCRWHDALLAGRVLGPDGLAAMFEPGRLGPAGSRDATGNGTASRPGGEAIAYGMGVRLKEFEGLATIEHGGGINGFRSDLRSFAAHKVSIAITVNTDGSNSEAFEERFLDLRDAAARTVLSLPS